MSTKRTIHTLTAVTLSIGPFAGVANAATLENGSFELNTNTGQFQTTGSTAITGWTTTLSGVEYFQPGTGNARDGDWVVDLAYFTSSLSGGITQTLSTTNGEALRLEFSLNTIAGSGRDGTAEVSLLINDVEVQSYDIENLTANWIWDDFTYDFVASGTETKIEFRNEQNANLHFANIDGIGVSQIPEPSTALLLGLGTLGLLRRRIIN